MGRKVDSVSFRCKLSPQGMRYLELIASIGIHGKTAAEVGSKLLSNELERLIIRENILSHLDAGAVPASSSTPKPSGGRASTPRKRTTAKSL